MICNAGGAVAIVDFITEAKGSARLPGIITLGYISAFDESLAMSVIACKGIAPLKEALIQEPDDLIKAASAWSLGQIGGHSADHSRAMAEADVPSHLLAVYKFQESSEDLKKKRAKRHLRVFCKCALTYLLLNPSFLKPLKMFYNMSYINSLKLSPTMLPPKKHLSYPKDSKKFKI